MFVCCPEVSDTWLSSTRSCEVAEERSGGMTK